MVKVHQDGRVINKSIYLVLGITTEGHKELLGIWISEQKEQSSGEGVNRFTKPGE